LRLGNGENKELPTKELRVMISGRFLLGALSAAAIAAGTVKRNTVRAPAPPVLVETLPSGGIQPQAAVDSKGIVHVCFFKGKPEAGDLFYYRYPVSAGPAAATRPIRVNSQPESATAMGTIRTEQIAIGRDDRVHVVWNGLGPKEGKPYAPLYMAYTRLNDAGTSFEPQRNLCTITGNLDGGGSVAADRAGNVYATWHAHSPNGVTSEAGRGVFMAVSRDNGKMFAKERLINPDPTGVCGCCSMRAFVDTKNRLRIMYRAAMKDGTLRDTMLLTSADQGKTFTSRSVDPWPLNSCPMSSMVMADDGHGLMGAWETRYQVFWSPLGDDGRPTRSPIVAPGADKSKHPILLTNGKRQTLFAWTEGTAWARGGSFSWQMYDSAGRELGPRGHSEGVPVWSLLSGYAKPDGAFVILH
jgi:hypothetical protein